ncbi:hypothetical protein PVK06_019628 [Gossypium arboreum]|uniref:Uncharacterized protein n=1 Tax=Gossypium arboreum TaxID=29729 RepID=A0ABR0PKR1_GOSAR|nr:hypothetical protein PVK06_019628 [Gossypium arboreum]
MGLLTQAVSRDVASQCCLHKLSSCIITHDLERLVENVNELNPTKPGEPIEPKTNESSNKSETEVNLVIETEAAKSKEELNNLESIKEPEVFEPREETNVDEPVESSLNLELTIPMPTSLNTVKKSKLSIMMDMMKFMHNQQQAY